MKREEEGQMKMVRKEGREARGREERTESYNESYNQRNENYTNVIL